MTKTIADLCAEETIRLDDFVWLAGAVEGFTDDDFFERLGWGRDEACHPSMAPLYAAPDDLWDSEEEWLEWAHEKGLHGFVVTAVMPKPQNVRADGSYYTFSWGFTCSEMFYVEQPFDAVSLAVAWKEALVEKARAKAREAANEVPA